MKSTLKMTLDMGSSKTLTLSLLDPKSDLTKSEVEGCLNEIISKKALVQGGKSPVGIKDIVVEKLEVEALA